MALSFKTNLVVFIYCSCHSVIGPWSCNSESDSGVDGGSSDTDSSETSQFVAEGEYEGEYWPTDGWRTCAPEEVGMDSEILELVYDYLAQPTINTNGTVIVKDGYIVAEAYFGNFTMNAFARSYSVAKSFLSAVVGISIDEGYLSGVDEQVFQFFPEWQKPGTETWKQDITVRHLLTMSSGLEWDESDYFSEDAVNDAFAMGGSSDFIQYALAKPSINEPGTVWNYSSGDSMLLSGVVEYTTGSRAYDLALDRLLEPIGIPNISWSHDPAGHTIGGWGINATVRDYAKFGYLFLNNGFWDGEQIVPESWVAESTSPAYVDVSHYGYQWWLLPALLGYQNSSIPADTYLAWGIYTQQVFVIPEHNLLVVRVANDPGSEDWSEVDFLTLILASIN